MMNQQQIEGYYLGVYTEKFFEFNIVDSRPQALFLAPKIAECLGIRSVIDFGSGAGHWVYAFLKCGVDAIGFEGSPNSVSRTVCPPHRHIIFDLRQDIGFIKKIDLAFSLEVAEHIEEEYAEVYLNNIVQQKPEYIIITAAPPGQGGDYHVNEQPYTYWIDRLAGRNYKLSPGIMAMFKRWCEIGRNLPKDKVGSELRAPWQDTQDIPGIWIPEWMPTNLLAFTKL